MLKYGISIGGLDRRESISIKNFMHAILNRSCYFMKSVLEFQEKIESLPADAQA